MITTSAFLLSPLTLLSPAAAKSPSKPPSPSASPSEAPPFLFVDPFKTHAAALESKFAPSCEASATFPALQHTLNDLFDDPPKGLNPWSVVLKKFFSGQHYPGGWDGEDPHKLDRLVLRMEYADLPPRVRAWIEKAGEAEANKLGESKAAKGLAESENFKAAKFFAVYAKPGIEEGTDEYVKEPKLKTKEEREAWRAVPAEDKVAIFAPGAVYQTLPLWVAEGSGCEDALADLTKYSPDPKDGGVIAGVTDRKRTSMQTRDFEFTITAQVLEKKDEAKDEL